MELLKLEFADAPEGSYNGNVAQLIKKIRYYRAEVSVEEFKAALPELQILERQLQNFDSSIGEEKRFYIQEIMDELDKEGEIESKLFEEIERSSKSIVKDLFDTEVSISDFGYEFRSNDGVFWVEFHGYISEKGSDSMSLVVKEVFRSACYKIGIIFIDSSLGGH